VEVEEIAKKYALINALEFNGKASLQAVLSKVLGEDERFKKDIKNTLAIVKRVVDEINSLSMDEQKKEFEKLGIKLEKKIEKKDLPDLPFAEKGKVITAFPPEPSKYPHLGHAKSALINYLYAKKYDGKFILRFEDTNPKMVKKEYYDAIIDGLKWLGIEWDDVDYISDHMEKFYEFAEKLVKDGKAYVCFCKQEEIKKLRAISVGCEHREYSVAKNLELWNGMFEEYKEGEATLRLKIDMSHQNTTMRDPSIMRIIDKEHPRTGKRYRVWPTYDFGTAVMDGLEGVTHRFRSKEFEMRDELQKYIQRSLGFRESFIQEIARFNLEGVPSSGRVIRQMIAEGRLLGWDDPRLTTLMALKRRGFLPEAIKEFLISTGISKAEATFSWDMLESFNRKHLDDKADRYFAVLDPVEIEVDGLPEKAEELLHPDHPERGKRIIPVSGRVYVERGDFERYKGKKIRLIGLCNLTLEKKCKNEGVEVIHEIPKIHWVSEPNVRIRVLMNDGKMVEMMAEPDIVRVRDYAQLVRFGFVKLESKDEMSFIFTHR